jgi:hypothetical protein
LSVLEATWPSRGSDASHELCRPLQQIATNTSMVNLHLTGRQLRREAGLGQVIQDGVQVRPQSAPLRTQGCHQPGRHAALQRSPEPRPDTPRLPTTPAPRRRAGQQRPAEWGGGLAAMPALGMPRQAPRCGRLSAAPTEAVPPGSAANQSLYCSLRLPCCHTVLWGSRSCPSLWQGCMTPPG